MLYKRYELCNTQDNNAKFDCTNINVLRANMYVAHAEDKMKVKGQDKDHFLRRWTPKENTVALTVFVSKGWFTLSKFLIKVPRQSLANFDQNVFYAIKVVQSV